MRLAASLAVLLAAPPVQAGAYYVGDINAVATGQGGAYVAAPDTPAAVWYNPGALALGHGWRFELEGAIIHTPLDYARAGDYERVENEEPFQPAGMAVAVTDFDVPDLAVALSVHTPSSNHYSYSERGAQRFQFVDGSNYLVHFHAAVAYRFFDQLSVGAAFGGSYFYATQRNLLSGALASANIDPENDGWAIPVDISVEDPWTFTANFGLSWAPLPELAVGVSVMPGFDVEATGKADIELPGLLALAATIEGDRIDAVISFPWVLRAGVRFTQPRWSIEAAAVWEGWSRLEAIHIRPDITVAAPAVGLAEMDLPAIELVKNYRDVLSLRLGGQVKTTSRLTLRAGTWFETAGSPPKNFDLSAPESKKLALTVGASYELPFGAIDLSYGHIFAWAVSVDDSEVSVLNVLSPENTRVVGNGEYDFSYDVVHLGVRAMFP